MCVRMRSGHTVRCQQTRLKKCMKFDILSPDGVLGEYACLNELCSLGLLRLFSSAMAKE